MQFKQYIHIERLGTTEVEGIELGIMFVFPKIDGSNGSVWSADNKIDICAGSRKRDLSLENDNQGFYEYVAEHEGILGYLAAHPDHRLYGEWLVPHTLKTYRPDAWRRFYIFDVSKFVNEDHEEFLPYNLYKPLIEEFGLDYIPPLCSIKNADYANLVAKLDVNDFLIEDGKGVGEGIVLKNYDYYNKFGRQVWAKIVRSEFKEQNYKAMGYPKASGKAMVEERIVEEFCTTALIEKTHAKIVSECDGWTSKLIPRLLSTVYYDLVNEDTWNVIKKFKDPVINFKTLRHLVVNQVKMVKQELF